MMRTAKILSDVCEGLLSNITMFSLANFAVAADGVLLVDLPSFSHPSSSVRISTIATSLSVWKALIYLTQPGIRENPAAASNFCVLQGVRRKGIFIAGMLRLS